MSSPVEATSPTRTETDLLGPREVPGDAYYGVHTLRAIDNFPISGVTVADVPQMVRAMVEVKKAEALANRDARVLPKEKADAIVAACDLILDEGRCMDQFPVDLFQGGAGTSVNMNANEVIANLALEVLGYEKGRYDVIHPNDDVNKSQSTNDAYPAGLCLATYRTASDLAAELERLAESFDVLADKYKNTIKMGRTQLQDAVPMTSGQEFGAFAELLREEVLHLGAMSQLLLEVNLGATAIGTGVNTPPGHQQRVVERLAEVTGLPVVSGKNLIEATSDTGQFLAVHGAMRRAATKLSKISSDLRLLSSGPRAGIGEINLPQMQAGSSIMPAKVNPVIPEVVNQICYKVIGNDTTVMMASEAGQLQLNAMEPVIAQSLFESGRLLARGAETLRKRCVTGITVNEDVCRKAVESSIGLVTYLNDVIGHEAGDEVGQECARTGKTVREVVIEKGLLTEEQVDDLLSTERLLSPVYEGEYYD